VTDERLVRQRIAGIAATMIAGQVDLLDGCRAIVQLRWSLSKPDSMDPDLLYLLAVEDDLEDVPGGEVRQRWAPEALAEKDRRKTEYLGRAREEILRSCQALNIRWGASG
jgi:hypothetical protein